jgi:uncharacterized membrane protein YhfC
MDISFLAHLANGLLMIAIPVGVAVFLTSRWKPGGRLWLIGAGTFILSQVGHIPFNLAVGPAIQDALSARFSPSVSLFLYAVFLGLSAGLFEELSRYGMFRWWAKDARSWRTGILTGAGHGGAEAILLGLLALNAFINLVALRNADLAALVPPEQLEAARQQVSAYWSATWYDSLLGAVERAFTIPVQIAFAVIVLQCFVRGQRRWLWLAVGFHAVIDASAVLAIRHFGVYGTEAMVAGYCALSIGILYLLRRPEPPDQEPPPSPSVSAFSPRPVEETPEKLNDTRFS